MSFKKLGTMSIVMAVAITCLPLISYAGFFKQLLDNVTIEQPNQSTENGNSDPQEDGRTTTSSSQDEGTFAVGDEHAGGIIFFVQDSGKHGLVASDTDIRGARSWDESIRACKNYKKNNYSDWFLPSREQLAELYLRRSVVGGWEPKSAYWSSTRSDIRDCAWLQYFSTGSQYRNFGTNYLHFARCVRSF